ncbi:MAG: PadR family transcriptional regulator, partial [Bacteroides sp.]
MIFNTGSALLDAIVLAVVSREPEGTYGYKITQEVRQAIDLSESTLYPVLR